MTTTPEFPASSGVVSDATSVFYFLLAPAIVLWFVYWKLSRRHLVELGDKLPGPTPLPVIGNLMTVLGSPHSESGEIYFGGPE